MLIHYRGFAGWPLTTFLLEIQTYFLKMQIDGRWLLTLSSLGHIDLLKALADGDQGLLRPHPIEGHNHFFLRIFFLF
jgi:hypothetical protein